MLAEIADLVMRYLNTIREELDESAKGDANSGPWFTTILCNGICCDSESAPDVSFPESRERFLKGWP